MKKVSYEVIKMGISKTSEAPKGKDIFYQCARCHTILPSWPKDNTRCSCMNISIDRDMNRLTVEDYSSFIVLRRRE